MKYILLTLFMIFSTTKYETQKYDLVFSEDDFEIRFYSSHSEAVQYGQVYAEDSSGEDAVLTKKNAMWSTGIKNRRTSGGPDGSPLPKYGGYAIYGNFIILCEGVNLEQSLETCSKLINELIN